MQFFHHNEKPSVLVSACLKGEKVRYDGKEKSYSGLEKLSSSLNLITICPEVAAGFGVPRAPVELVQINAENSLKVRGRELPHRDVTTTLEQACDKILHTYPHISGFILKSKSPSCGDGTTPIYDEQGNEQSFGSGMFASAAQATSKPIIDELRLQDRLESLRFVTQCFISQDWELAQTKHRDEQIRLLGHYRERLELPTLKAYNQLIAGVKKAPEALLKFLMQQHLE